MPHIPNVSEIQPTSTPEKSDTTKPRIYEVEAAERLKVTIESVNPRYEEELARVLDETIDVERENPELAYGYYKFISYESKKWMKICAERPQGIRDTIYTPWENPPTGEEILSAVVLSNVATTFLEKFSERGPTSGTTYIVAPRGIDIRASGGSHITLRHEELFGFKSDPSKGQVLMHELVHRKYGGTYLNFMTEGIAMYAQRYMEDTPSKYDFGRKEVTQRLAAREGDIEKLGVTPLLKRARKGNGGSENDYEYSYSYGFWIVDEITRNYGIELLNKLMDKLSIDTNNPKYNVLWRLEPKNWEHLIFMNALNVALDGDVAEIEKVKNTLLARVNRELSA